MSFKIKTVRYDSIGILIFKIGEKTYNFNFRIHNPDCDCDNVKVSAYYFSIDGTGQYDNKIEFADFFSKLKFGNEDYIFGKNISSEYVNVDINNLKQYFDHLQNKIFKKLKKHFYIDVDVNSL
jgi:hypothetical protein